MNSISKNKKYKILVVLSTVILTFVVIFSVVNLLRIFLPQHFFNGFVPAVYSKGISENVKKAQGIEIPEFIDKQIIGIHSTARTGVHLTDINNIVVHYVGNPGTTAKNNRDYFNKITTGVSSHFIVGLDGEIIQCLPLWEKSAASNNRNSDTISIEVCHLDESGKFNEDTYSSLVKLCVWLCYEFNLNENGIIRHYDITGKNCPKFYVENPNAWDKFIHFCSHSLR